MNIVLEAKNLNKTYLVNKNQQRNIIENINLTIKEGEFVALMGPSGSGKSTLLYNLSGMDKPSSGSVNFNGQEISAITEDDLAKIRLNQMGFIFQQSHLLNNLNIFDNIILPAFYAKKFSYDEIMRRTKKLMEKLGIAELANNDITQASGGQLQKASICRALINQPVMLFGDEPTGALNSKSANDVMDVLSEINSLGTTLLIATHDIKVAAKTERIIYLFDGKIFDEKIIGKYSQAQSSDKKRENALSDWLTSLGF